MSGGGLDEDGMPRFNFDGVGGTVTLMFLSGALKVVRVVGRVMKTLGWRPKDDAPEFK